MPLTAVELSVPSSLVDRQADREPTHLESARYYSGRVIERIRGRMYRMVDRG
jgi:hypothetical protein